MDTRQSQTSRSGSTHVEQVTDPICYHGEGPVWSEQWGGLRWLDMLAGDLLHLKPDGSVQRRHVAAIVAAVRPRRGGGAVLGIERGFALENADGTITRMDDLWSDRSVRMNEGGCDPDGRFYCGSMAYDERSPLGRLYRLDPDGGVLVVLEKVTISNGLEWSPDGSRAYYVDTPTCRIDVFDYDTTAGLSARRPFVDMTAEGGLPDGLTVDREGAVWVAIANRGVVRRYRADGGLDEEVAVPAKKVTACTFGGPDLDHLYITTSKDGLEPGSDPFAGSLFRLFTGPLGRPIREFAG